MRRGKQSETGARGSISQSVPGWASGPLSALGLPDSVRVHSLTNFPSLAAMISHGINFNRSKSQHMPNAMPLSGRGSGEGQLREEGRVLRGEDAVGDARAISAGLLRRCPRVCKTRTDAPQQGSAVPVSEEGSGGNASGRVHIISQDTPRAGPA